MKKRDPFFDNVKILLMLLVVLGHVLSINKNESFNLATYNWIYSFHMPLFILISGFFTSLSDKKKFWKGIFRLIETFLVFTLVHVCISLVQGETVGIDVFYVPRWTLWYLLSLIWWRLILYFILMKIRCKSYVLIAICICVSVVAGWMPFGKELSLQRTFYFLPFFTIGYVAKQNKFSYLLKPDIALSFLIIVWFFFFIYRYNGYLLLQQFNNAHYGSPIFISFVRFLFLFISLAMSSCFLSIAPSKEYTWTQFGKDTLFIYMWHSVILSWRFYVRDSFNIPTTLPYCILYAVIVMGIIYLMNKMRFFHWFLNPITSILYK